MELYSHNSIAVLIFPADPAYPRLTRKVAGQIRRLLAELQRERLFRGVVIAANSKSFCAGADLEEVSRLDGVAAFEFARAGQTLCNEIARFPVPVVAAIRGFCLGGGLDLALACHARVATHDASFGYPGASLGLMTGWGGTQRLSSLIGKPAAAQIFLTGERIPATQAFTLGLVDELVCSQDLNDCAARLTERRAASSLTRL